MKLDRYDVEAIAKSRISRKEASKTNMWMWGMFIAMGGGFILVWKVSTTVGYGLVVLAILSFFYYSSQITKKQNEYRRKLLDEWYDEEEKANEKKDVK